MGVTSSCLYMATARAASVARARPSSLYARRCSRRFSLSCRRTASSAARRARVPRDGGADLRVEPGDLGGDGPGLVAVLLELRRSARPAGGGRERHGGRERAEREQGDQRQTTYRMARLPVRLLERQAARAARSRSSGGRCQARPEGQGRNLALRRATAQAQESARRSSTCRYSTVAPPSSWRNRQRPTRPTGRSGRPSSSTTGHPRRRPRCTHLTARSTGDELNRC